MSGWTDALVKAQYDKLKRPPAEAEIQVCITCAGACDKNDLTSYVGRCSECRQHGLVWVIPAVTPAAPAKAKGRKAPRLKEAAVERQIIDLLEAHKWLVLRTNKFCGQGFASQGAIEPGMPDLQARKLFKESVLDWQSCGAPEYVSTWRITWVEVKRPGGKVSVAQATWHQLAQRRGETVIVAENVETIAAAIGVKL